MKVPIRPAPPPPQPNQKFPIKGAPDWGNLAETRWNTMEAPVQKKKPPPRPPPPKFGNKKAVPSRPSQLIAGLFHRKNNANSKINEVQISCRTPGETANGDQRATNGMLLIDFSSPPSSPTFTTRSSSDALSVNSFGSDGVTQSSGSSGNASNVESGFEDDFDLFSNGLKKLEGQSQPRDPWSPLPKAPAESKNSLNEKSWATFPSPSSSKKAGIGVSAMPTIIRSKPEGHKAQPKLKYCDTETNVNVLTEVLEPTRHGLSKLELDDSIFEEVVDEGWSSESPPMPTCPPPPPPDVINELLESVKVGTVTEPNGVALYDYPGEQSGDLSFKKDDVIYLVRRIDENWLVGRKNGREGSVPANFITIRVPPQGEEDTFVTALYAFHPETWDDLAFEEGSVIKVTHRIDQDWLYGECNGKCGQFPANFVDRIPTGLPPRSEL
ncbi:hypothetical protein RUM44_012702 [Polyplax serrata]|uniref:SH3 domain-containing protein n=1 Tax=Polyplax serrata TaxID=468196 RepID=A0ABR1BGY1_POLSC